MKLGEVILTKTEKEFLKKVLEEEIREILELVKEYQKLGRKLKSPFLL